MASEALRRVEADLAQLPAERRKLAETAISLLASAVLSEGVRELRKLVREQDSERPGRVRNRARLQLMSARVEADSVRGAELGKRLGISRQRLAQLRDSGKLLGLQPPLRTEHWYPEWQFDASGGVRPVVPRLLRAAREARLSPLSLHLLLTNPEAGIDGRPLVELLDDRPDDVLDLVAAGAAQGT
jgi:hypothetical protein